MAAATGRRDIVTQHSQQVETDMATMVAIGRITVIPGIVGRRSGSGIVPGEDSMAIECPRRAESEYGQHQP